MKTIWTLKNAWRGLFAVAATLAFVPLTSGLNSAEAAPPGHARAYGYRRNRTTYRRPVVIRRTYRRPVVVRRTVRRPYRPSRVYRPYRPYRRTPSSNYSYRRNRNSYTRTYRTPYGSTRTVVRYRNR